MRVTGGEEDVKTVAGNQQQQIVPSSTTADHMPSSSSSAAASLANYMCWVCAGSRNRLRSLRYQSWQARYANEQLSSHLRPPHIDTLNECSRLYYNLNTLMYTLEYQMSLFDRLLETARLHKSRAKRHMRRVRQQQLQRTAKNHGHESFYLFNEHEVTRGSSGGGGAHQNSLLSIRIDEDEEVSDSSGEGETDSSSGDDDSAMSVDSCASGEEEWSSEAVRRATGETRRRDLTVLDKNIRHLQTCLSAKLTQFNQKLDGLFEYYANIL
jgi:hypothetical protein